MTGTSPTAGGSHMVERRARRWCPHRPAMEGGKGDVQAHTAPVKERTVTVRTNTWDVVIVPVI